MLSDHQSNKNLKKFTLRTRIKIYLFISAFVHNYVQQRDKTSDSTPAALLDHTSLSKFSAIMQSSEDTLLQLQCHSVQLKNQ